jgi:uncharacterized phage-associated protein
MSAFFGQKQGGVINVLKLTKLLYLADRESLRRYGHPITYDLPVSMPHGPVLSRTLDLLNGFVGGAEGAQWDEWIEGRSGHDVAVKRGFTSQDLDELSEVDLKVLELVWHQFGPMDQWTLRKWTHDNCPEWEDPKGSSKPIDEVVRLRSVGMSADQAQALAEEIQAERRLDALFAQSTQS